MEHLEKELKVKLRESKLAHRELLGNAFKAKDPKTVWDTMRTMTGMTSSAKPIVTDKTYLIHTNLPISKGVVLLLLWFISLLNI